MAHPAEPRDSFGMGRRSTRRHRQLVLLARCAAEDRDRRLRGHRWGKVGARITTSIRHEQSRWRLGLLDIRRAGPIVRPRLCAQIGGAEGHVLVRLPGDVHQWRMRGVVVEWIEQIWGFLLAELGFIRVGRVVMGWAAVKNHTREGLECGGFVGARQVAVVVEHKQRGLWGSYSHGS
jgi:hypothetical protein